MATTEEKIAKSSGNDTLKYSQKLEDEGDSIINQIYHPEKLKDKEKPEKIEKEEPTATEPIVKKEEKEEPTATEPNKEEKQEEEIELNQDDTIETLKEKLKKSEERRRNTQSEFTKREHAEREKDKTANAIIDGLKQTIIDLKTTTEIKTGTKADEREKDKEISAGIEDINEQFKDLENIDPDIAKPIKKIIEDLTGKITGLQTELDTKTKLLQKTSIEDAEEQHFSKIEKAHPDYEKILDSPEFDTWIDSLPKYIGKIAREDIDNGTAEDIIELFDTYKESFVAGDNKDLKKQQKLELAKTLVNPDINKSKNIKQNDTPTIKYTRKMIRAMSAKEYAEKEADIDKEAAAGRIPPE